MGGYVVSESPTSGTLRTASFLMLGLVLGALPALSAPISDVEIRKAIIAESLAGYPGNCPCPYNVDRRGHICGKRSAYSRPGGYSPICYEANVSEDLIQRYRAGHSR